ncbi:MAG: glycosyltransferase family 2 protein [Firmicutes bacterium]|nr:glycosyltransferase family 2 protein [Bacillota bacterium]
MYYITAVIPAFNEEKTIGEVIKTVSKVDIIDNIVVISDGSKDNTANIAKGLDAEVLELSENIGKGGAIKRGINRSNGDIILFLDADLVNLKPKHIMDLLKPVISDNYQMSIGVFDSGRKVTDLAQKITPFLSGQRAIKRDVIEQISNLDVTRYGVELAITKYVNKNNIKYKEVILPNLTHIMKEEKLGLFKGFTERLKMYWDIVKMIDN